MTIPPYRQGTDQNDTLTAQGAEWLNGLLGADTVTGSEGVDILWGSVPTAERPQPDISNDVLDGRGGNDLLWGWAGSDSILGGAGDDFVVGDLATLIAPGRDTLDGGAGSDSMIGGDGNDLLVGDLEPTLPGVKNPAPGAELLQGVPATTRSLELKAKTPSKVAPAMI
ncbi:MAG: calcium-binding protein [Alphaproteobacteria bacterium]|nr:calcium-binding protein [Alphaproteobacteria bacterium]